MGSPTNIQRRRTRAEVARKRAAEARVAARRRQHRRRVLAVVGSALGVVAVVAVIVVVAVTTGGKSKTDTTTGPRRPAPASVVSAVTQVPTATLDAVGIGAATQLPKAVSDPALSADGKPEVLYVGAEYCPFCAAERWALVQALSRFGTFSNLSLTTSATTETFPNTASFSFYGASYQSDYLSFVGKELNTNEPLKGGKGFKPLERLTAAENKLFSSYTGGAFPFLYLGGKYAVAGATNLPDPLHGLTAQQIAGRLADRSSAVAQSVDGAANGITAALCRLTGGQPGPVCTAPALHDAQARLG